MLNIKITDINTLKNNKDFKNYFNNKEIFKII